MLVKYKPVITHDHDDHNGRLSDDQVMVKGAQDLSPKMEKLKEELDKVKLNIVIKIPDLSIVQKQEAGKIDINADSLMLYHDCGDCRIYFLGDSPLIN